MVKIYGLHCLFVIRVHFYDTGSGRRSLEKFLQTYRMCADLILTAHSTSSEDAMLLEDTLTRWAKVNRVERVSAF